MDYRKLADILRKTEPFTLLLFTEQLERSHWKYKKYVSMRRIEIVSELDETVFRHFGSELNRKMAEYLESHSDPDDEHLHTLKREYYPEARAILREEYQWKYPRSWKKKWRTKEYAKTRIGVKKKRRFKMPPPLCRGATHAPQQYYFMTRTRTYVQGCDISSGLRENHSYYGLAFAKMSERQPVPAYIFVYDKNNELKFVGKTETFVILPYTLGSNCHESARTVRAVTKKTPRIIAVESKDYAEIEEILITD